MYYKTNKKYIGQNRSQCLWLDSKKSIEWNGIYIERSWKKTNTNTQTEKMRLKCTKEKQLWRVGNLMETIFSDESRIYIGQGNNAGTFVQCFWNKIYIDDCLKKNK